MPFTDEDEVTPLPCDMRHYFHTSCIEDWMKQKNICPLCKKVITKEELDNCEEKFKKLLDDNE